jgi:hypothetical protein
MEKTPRIKKTRSLARVVNTMSVGHYPSGKREILHTLGDPTGGETAHNHLTEVQISTYGNDPTQLHAHC